MLHTPYEITEDGLVIDEMFKMIAHRYRLDVRDIAPMMMMISSSMEEGGLRYYRNRKTGIISIGFDCGGCDAHHALLEIETLDEEDMSRVFFDVRGCDPFDEVMSAREGFLSSIPANPLISWMIEEIEEVRETPRVAKFDAEFAFYRIFLASQALEDGSANIGLDAKTGRTAVAYICDECESIHPMFLVALPQIDDLRANTNLEAIDDPFEGFEFNPEEINNSSRILH